MAAKKTKWPPKHKIGHNFQAKSMRFCMVGYIDLPPKISQNQDGRQKTKWPPKYKIDHNLVNAQAIGAPHFAC